MTDPTPKDDTKTGGLNAGSIRDFIRQEILNLWPGKGSSAPTPDNSSDPDVKSQVATALEQLKRRESREQRDKAIDEMLANYNKPPEETAPVERRRVEKIMGWGE